MDKYKKTFRLIYAYYILTVVIGGGQILWAMKFGWEYKEPDVAGYYMFMRFILAATVLAFMLLKMRRHLCWTVVVESSMNIFVLTYMIYYQIWYLIKSASEGHFSQVFKIVGVPFAWDLALVCISVGILYFMINRWSEIGIQPSAADGASKARTAASHHR